MVRGLSKFISGTKPLEDPDRIPMWVTRATRTGTFDHDSRAAEDVESSTKQQGDEAEKKALCLQGQIWKNNEHMLRIFLHRNKGLKI